MRSIFLLSCVFLSLKSFAAEDSHIRPELRQKSRSPVQVQELSDSLNEDILVQNEALASLFEAILNNDSDAIEALTHSETTSSSLANVPNAAGLYPIHFAIQNNVDPTTILTLHLYGADLTICNSEGQSPLQMAQALGNNSLVEVLRELLAIEEIQDLEPGVHETLQVELLTMSLAVLDQLKDEMLQLKSHANALSRTHQKNLDRLTNFTLFSQSQDFLINAEYDALGNSASQNSELTASEIAFRELEAQVSNLTVSDLALTESDLALQDAMNEVPNAQEPVPQDWEDAGDGWHEVEFPLAAQNQNPIQAAQQATLSASVIGFLSSILGRTPASL